MKDFIEDYGEFVVLSLVVSSGIFWFEKIIEVVTNLL